MQYPIRTGPRCSDCKEMRDDLRRIPIEIVDKKSKEIIEVSYGEIVCTICFGKRYKDRTKIRVYV